jgi:type IV pilus assembly protein PilW
MARGFSLVELMVALALSMIVVGVVAVLFSATSKNRGDLERSNRLEQNVAYAIDHLSDDLRQAGYWGEMQLDSVTYQEIDPCTVLPGAQGVSLAPFSLPVAVLGYDKAQTIPGSCTPNRKVGTGAVTVRRLAIDPTPPASANGALFLQISGCTADPTPWIGGVASGTFTRRKIGCAALADVRRLEVHTYYVANCNECGVDNIPTLKRVSLTGNTMTSIPIAEGIENLAFEYGWDLDNDGTADEWRESAAPGGGGAPNTLWQNVVGVRAYVLGRSTDQEAGYSGVGKSYYMGQYEGYVTPSGPRFKRLVADANIRVNNPSMQREKP